LGKQTQSDETVGQFAVGLLSDEFIAGVTAPKVNAADLEEFASGRAKELDQRGGVGPLRGFGGDPQ